MKILVTGANGMLAKDIKNIFKDEELFCTDSKELDIINYDDVVNYVTKIKPDYIINCAAYTAVDNAEDDKENAYKVNAEGSKNLAKATQMVDSTLVHISTDYVFAGDKDVNQDYLEEEQIAPVTVYGATKAKGEEEIKNNCSKYYIFRTAWLYGTGGKNFIKTMLKLGKEREEVSVVNDQHGSPTYTVDLAMIVKQAINKNIPYGIYHATNQGFTTWYDFTKKIFEIAQINCKINPVTSEQFASKAKRPKNSKLSKNKLLSQGIIIPEYEDALIRYLKEEQIID